MLASIHSSKSKEGKADAKLGDDCDSARGGELGVVAVTVCELDLSWTTG